MNSNNRICNVATYVEVIETRTINSAFGQQTTDKIETFYKGISVFNFIRLDFEVLYKSFKNLSEIRRSRTFEQNILSDEVTEYLKENRELLNSDEKHIIKLIF